MKQFLQKLFFKDKGEFRTLPLVVVFSILTLIGIFSLAPEIGYGFSHRFFRAGIFQLLGPSVGVFLFYQANKKYKESGDGNKSIKYLLIGALLFWAGLFGSAVAQKLDRQASIPDVAIYYGNGKIKNAIEADRNDYYFKYIDLTVPDSLYVVEYGEEPGYNKTNAGVRSGEYPKSIAPRADEDWQRPPTKQGQKFIDGKRN